MVIAEAASLVARELGGHAEPAFYDAIVAGTLIVEPLTGEDSQRIRELVDAPPICLSAALTPATFELVP